MPVKTFVHAVCVDTNRFKGDVKTATSSFKAGLRSVSDLRAVRTRFAAFIGKVATLATRMIKQIGEAGVPHVKGGKSAVARIATLFTELRDALLRAKQDAMQLPTSNPQQFAAEAKTIATTLQQNEAGASTSVKALELDYPELAAVKDPACPSPK